MKRLLSCMFVFFLLSVYCLTHYSCDHDIPFYTIDDNSENGYWSHEYGCTFPDEYHLIYKECGMQYLGYSYDEALSTCDACPPGCIKNKEKTCSNAYLCLVNCESWDDSCPYEAEIAWLQDSCGIPLTDENTGTVVDLSTALDQCRSCLGQCGWVYRETGNCEAAEECVEALCVISSLPDGGDDDDDDDEIDDDDDSTFDPDDPVLVDAYWDPSEFDMVEACIDSNADPCTALIWEVCDQNSDLAGGYIYVYAAGTSSPAFGEDLPWIDYLDGSPVNDCDHPYATGFNIYFDGVMDDWCPEQGQSFSIGVDIEVSDGQGNFSNMITDVEVVWNCE